MLSLQNKNISLTVDILILTLAHISAASSHLNMPRRCALAKIHLFTVRKDMIFYPACAAYTLFFSTLIFEEIQAVFGAHNGDKISYVLVCFQAKKCAHFCLKT